MIAYSENSRIRFLSAARSGRPHGAYVDIGERARGVHIHQAPSCARERLALQEIASKMFHEQLKIVLLKNFKELSVKFLELNHTNLHNCLKGLPSLHTYENDQDQAVRKSEHVHLARVPRCQRRRRGGARSALRREIEFSNSRVKWRLIHLSTSLVKIVVEE